MKKICHETIIILNHEKTQIDEIAMLLGEQITKSAKVTDLCIADLGEKILAYSIKNHKKVHCISLFYWAEKQLDIVPIIENILDSHPDVLKHLTVGYYEELFTPEDTVKHFEASYTILDWIKRPEHMNKPEPVIDAWDVIFGRATYPEK